jgi:hypothetical protein
MVQEMNIPAKGAQEDKRRNVLMNESSDSESVISVITDDVSMVSSDSNEPSLSNVSGTTRHGKITV